MLKKGAAGFTSLSVGTVGLDAVMVWLHWGGWSLLSVSCASCVHKTWQILKISTKEKNQFVEYNFDARGDLVHKALDCASLWVESYVGFTNVE